MTKRDYEVASSRALRSMGRFDTDMPASNLGNSSSGSDLPASNSMIFRATVLFSRQSSVVIASLKGEKVHGKLCRAKSMIKKALLCSKAVDACRTPESTLWSELYSTSINRSVRAKDEEGNRKPIASIVSEDSPYVARLPQVSKLLPKFTVEVSRDDETTSRITAECDRKNEEEGIFDRGFHVAPLCLRSPKLSSMPSNRTSEGEAAFYYTPNTRMNGGIFPNPDEDPLIDCSVSKLMIELREVMEQTSCDGTVTPSVASTASRIASPSPLPKLRHTAISSTRGFNSDSLRSQYSASEFEWSLPLLKASIRSPVDNEAVKDLRIAPSLEKSLCETDLEVYEENMVATAAPIIRGICPDVVDVRYPKVYETYERQAHVVPNHHQYEHDLTVRLLTLPETTYPSLPNTSCASSSEHLSAVTAIIATTSPFMASKRMSVASSNLGGSIIVLSLPLEVRETLFFSVTYRDAKLFNLSAKYYNEVAEAETSGIESRRSAWEQHLIRQIDLALEPDLVMRHIYCVEDKEGSHRSPRRGRTSTVSIQ